MSKHKKVNVKFYNIKRSNIFLKILRRNMKRPKRKIKTNTRKMLARVKMAAFVIEPFEICF